MITPPQLIAAATRAGYMPDLVSRRDPSDPPMLNLWLTAKSRFPEVTIVFEPEGLTWGPNFEFVRRTFGDPSKAVAEIVATVSATTYGGERV